MSEQNDKKPKKGSFSPSTTSTTTTKEETIHPKEKSSLLFNLTLISNSFLVAVIGVLLYKIYYDEKIYTDCGDYFRAGFRTNGVYEIQPLKELNKRINVYCNMTNGGWTVWMKREANSKYNVDFQVGIKHYKHGFGILSADHFLGLDNVNLLTRAKKREMMAIVNETEYRYSNFQVLNEYYHYKFILGDELDKFIDGSSFLRLNNTLFSTIDVDYDLAANSNCSNGWKAGWWFTDCFDHSVCATCLIMHGNSGVKNLAYSVLLLK